MHRRRALPLTLSVAFVVAVACTTTTEGTRVASSPSSGAPSLSIQRLASERDFGNHVIGDPPSAGVVAGLIAEDALHRARGQTPSGGTGTLDHPELVLASIQGHDRIVVIFHGYCPPVIAAQPSHGSPAPCPSSLGYAVVLDAGTGTFIQTTFDGSLSSAGASPTP